MLKINEEAAHLRVSAPLPHKTLVFRCRTKDCRRTGHLQNKLLVRRGLFLHVLKGIAFSIRTVNTQVVLATVIALERSCAFRVDMTKLMTSSAYCRFIWARDSGVIEAPGLSSLPSSICPSFHMWSKPFRWSKGSNRNGAYGLLCQMSCFTTPETDIIILRIGSKIGGGGGPRVIVLCHALFLLSRCVRIWTMLRGRSLHAEKFRLYYLLLLPFTVFPVHLNLLFYSKLASGWVSHSKSHSWDWLSHSGWCG